MSTRDWAIIQHFGQGLIYGGLAAALPVAINALSSVPTALDWKVVATAFVTGVLLSLDKWVRDSQRANPPDISHG